MRALALLALAGCEFHHGQLDTARDDARLIDAPPDAAILSATLFVSDFGANKVYRYAIGASVTTPPAPVEIPATSALGLVIWPPTGELFVTQATSAVISRIATPLATATPNGSITGGGLGSQPHVMVVVDG